MSHSRLAARAAPPLACAVAALMPLAAHAATPSEHMPPPGLYRINDSHSQQKRNLPRGATIQSDHQRDGETGNESRTTTFMQDQGAQKAAGSGGRTMCIAAPRGGLPPTLPATPGCKTGPGVAGPNGMVARMQCAFGDTTITTRRLDAATWQFETQTVVKQSQVGVVPAGAHPMRGALEALAANGTPQERKFAAEQLANMPRMEAQSAALQAQRAAIAPQAAQARAAAAERGIAFDGAKPVSEQSAQYTITRMADKCEG